MKRIVEVKSIDQLDYYRCVIGEGTYSAGLMGLKQKKPLFIAVDEEVI